jgi:hydrogenase nickel incorporation protein HypA/HybF
MHELSITESILEIALRHTAEADAKKITDIHLVIGKLSSIVDDSVQFYWDIVSDGTAAQGAVLHFRRVRIEILCKACGERYHPEELDLACPACGSRDVRIVAGEEFRMEAIEVE